MWQIDINSAVLKLSYTAFQKVTSCNSGLTFARILVQKVGEWGTHPPVEKSRGRFPPASPPHYTLPSFAAANHVVTLTRVTNERVVNWVDVLQVSSVQFVCCEQELWPVHTYAVLRVAALR